jgi:hypothetical protein
MVNEVVGARRPLLGHWRQSVVLQRLETFWAAADGLDQRQTNCQGASVE